MKNYAGVTILVLASLLVTGCVSKSRYTEATEEASAAKAELERALAQRDAYEQQVKTLKELNTKLSQEAQLVKDELRRIEHGRDQERGSLAERNQQLEGQTRTLVAEYRKARKEIVRLKQREKQLSAQVGRHRKELRELRAGTAAARAGSSKAASPAKAPAPQAVAKAPGPAGAARATRRKPAPVNLNTASANDMMNYLGLSKQMADKVISNRPYRIKGELVAKNVMPKETFDTIRDRITVRQ